MANKKYLAYIRQDEGGYYFITALNRFDPEKLLNEKQIMPSGYSLPNGVYRLFTYGIKIIDSDDALKAEKFSKDLIYTLTINDIDLEPDRKQILENNYRPGTDTFFGKKMYFGRGDDRKISLKTIRKDNSCFELFSTQDELKLDEIYNFIDNVFLDHEPVTTYIYLTDNNFTIGPFSFEKTENAQFYKLVPSLYPDFRVDIYKQEEFFKYCSIIDIPNDKKITLIYNSIPNSSNLPSEGQKDCIPLENLIDFCVANNINATNWGAKQYANFDLSEERKNRLIQVEERKEHNKEQYNKLLQGFLNKPNFIKELLNKEEAKEFIRKEFPNIVDDSNQLSLEIQKQLDDANDEIDNLHNNIVEKDKKIESLKEDNSKYSNTIEELQKQVNQFNETSKKYIESLDLDKEISEKDKTLNTLKNEIIVQENILSYTKDRIKSAITKFEDDLKKNYDSISKFIDMDANTMLLSKTLKIASEYSRAYEHKEIISLKYDENNKNHKCYNQINDLINFIYEEFQKSGRTLYEYNDIANIVLCMSLGFLTIFAGEPGTGKTSFVKLFTKFLGMQKNNRYAEVSVEKGWTTKRDLLGYYNPLTKEINQNNLTLFNGLKQLNKESEEKIFDFPYIVLLDEANLSPMEYYWSDFMRFCDYYNEESSCKINISDNFIFTIPKTMRFFATVNLDHTTEILSPRLIDRSWIVKLPCEDFSLDYKFVNIENSEDYPIITNNIFEQISNCQGEPIPAITGDRKSVV